VAGGRARPAGRAPAAAEAEHVGEEAAVEPGPHARRQVGRRPPPAERPAPDHYELPPDDTVPADAVRDAAAGDVVYLTRNGAPVAAVVPAEAAEYLEALEDAADVIAARRALADGAPSVPAEQVWAELGLDGRS
jgi:prevent-host-death family protein